MIRTHRLLGRLVLLAGVAALSGLLAFSGTARAQGLSTFSAGILGGLGGSSDVDSGQDFGNHGFQINLGLETEPRTQLDLHLGRLSLDHKGAFGSLTGASLSYVNIGGEYRYDETYYQSGVYLALGAYRLYGEQANGRDRTQTAIGAALGLTGEFPINRHVGILVELAGHYALLDEAKVFGTAHAGVTFHF
ncbi:MAG TPA: hypothetical protein VFE33_14745 [Thermoanaerobaculia bacterium]|nr:hypothetical protein [Thermoanaerobaculia bacterium]